MNECGRPCNHLGVFANDVGDCLRILQKHKNIPAQMRRDMSFQNLTVVLVFCGVQRDHCLCGIVFVGHANH